MEARTSAVFGAALVTAVVVAATFYWKYLSKRKRKVGKLSQINLYPIKSGPPLHLERAECTPCGLRYKSLCDR